MVGDFNARTGSIPDVAEIDQSMFEFVNIDTNDVFSSNVYDQLSKQNMLFSRCSQDHVVNRCGRILTEFCRLNEFVILNGRSFDDKVGKLTCKDTSTIDYIISSCEGLSLFKAFCVNEFCPLLSDIHCSLTFMLSANRTESEKDNITDKKEQIRKWDPLKAHQFVNNINMPKIDEVIRKVTEGTDEFCQNRINEIVTEVESVFIESAQKTFGVYTPSRNSSKTTKSD